MTSLALLFTLSSTGISETVYLIRKRIASEKPICIYAWCFWCLMSAFTIWLMVIIILASGYI